MYHDLGKAYRVQTQWGGTDNVCYFLMSERPNMGLKEISPSGGWTSNF